MNYVDGREVMIGDRVKLADDPDGVVVASIDTGHYSAEFSELTWSYLKKGVLVRFPRFGLLHYKEPEPDLVFVARDGEKKG